MEQNLSQYKIFYEVAKAGNISKAAKDALHQPACYQQSHQQVRRQFRSLLFTRSFPRGPADFPKGKF